MHRARHMTGAQVAARTPRRGAAGILPTSISLETALYGLIFLAAVLTRFWDLGSRALHHDESLHTYYSWLYAEGFGYQHNPLMHGPFLFHANALLYLLFGASDYVSRVMPAAAGVIVVMLPWLLRGPRLLGRWGALFASALLLVSPSILFYSRFIRHDIYCLLGTFALAIAVVRYVERREPRWAILGGLATGFLFTTKEVSFIVLFIFVTYLAIAVALRAAPGLLLIAAGALVAFGAAAMTFKALGVGPLPGIPWDQPTGDQIWRFTVALFRHPVVVAGIGIALLAFVAAVWLLDRRRAGAGWIEGILGSAPEGSTAAALRTLLTERRGLLIGAGLGTLVFVVLYSSLFSNMMGLASGTFGALGYWLGQQGVQRGEQPWFYYLLLVPQYEFIAALFFPVAIVCAGWRWLRAWRSGSPLGHRDYVQAFLIYWAVLMLGVLSWAGEKMPWLTVHIALPLTLLAAALLGDAAERLVQGWHDWTPARRRETLAAGAGVVGLAVAWFLVMAWASAGPYVEQATSFGTRLQRTLRPWAADHWWVVYIPWLLLALLLVAAAVRLGVRRTLATLALAGAVALTMGQVHVGWHMTYREGDVPTDMLIYVQTSPYVPRVTKELEALSQEMTGGMDLEVWYDSGTQWPFNWYLRNFPNRRYFGTQLTEKPTAPVVLVSQDNITPQLERQLEGYTFQQYPMRWWFPEEQTYRRFAYAPELNNESRQNYQDDRQPPFTLLDVAGSVWRSVWSLHEPQQQGKIFRLVAFRELPAPIGSYWFRVYVRDDLVPYLNGLRY
ncbi:flippase activity-associated protein Agl23 [Sphaerobacter sp.]|uniref:flippase activity-associated protein Agl23 n=1 Tax=Sphaerobacter sp. TaxID=2099654 RepID=UPI001D5470DE|nr:flippase activity-associated protein Agl23 [Sphaerobacter sp.]MBX5445030.1 TIGR03663 family protein [Sphaerobacter sp.]